MGRAPLGRHSKWSVLCGTGRVRSPPSSLGEVSPFVGPTFRRMAITRPIAVPHACRGWRRSRRRWHSLRYHRPCTRRTRSARPFRGQPIDRHLPHEDRARRSLQNRRVQRSQRAPHCRPPAPPPTLDWRPCHRPPFRNVGTEPFRQAPAIEMSSGRCRR